MPANILLYCQAGGRLVLMAEGRIKPAQSHAGVQTSTNLHSPGSILDTWTVPLRVISPILTWTDPQVILYIIPAIWDAKDDSRRLKMLCFLNQPLCLKHDLQPVHSNLPPVTSYDVCIFRERYLDLMIFLALFKLRLFSSVYPRSVSEVIGNKLLFCLNPIEFSPFCITISSCLFELFSPTSADLMSGT